ncbi:MAG: ribbon-helix-helix protein, CopG family [Thermoanaerobaculia bacterium]
MVAKGFKTGGRKALSEAGAAYPARFRLPIETMEGLAEAAEWTGETQAVIVRRAIDRELARLRRQHEKVATKRTGRPPR